MHYHWQNLTAEDGSGRFPWYGRCWLHAGTRGLKLSLEWKALSNSWGCGVDLDPDDAEVTAHIAIGLLSLYLTIGGVGRLLRRLLPQRESTYAPGLWLPERREISLRFFGGGPWWALWVDPMADSTPETRRKWWRQGHLDVPDLILGRARYSRVPGNPQPVAVPMPEGDYRAVLTPIRCEWRRPRWLLPRRWSGWEVNIEGGIPTEPGDGIWGLSVQGEDIAGAIAAVRECVLDSRRRDAGSRNWRPAEV